MLYYYRGEWQIQTSSQADGDGYVKGFDLSFRELFWQVWQELGYQFPQVSDRCFMFELLTPMNRVIVPQNKNRLVLHGVRNLSNLQEENPQFWGEKSNWEAIKTFNFQDLDSVLEKAKNLSILEGEGFIVCDRYFNRIKIKTSQYVLLSYKFGTLLQTSEIESRMLDLILICESDEFLAYFPEFEPTYRQVKSKLDRLIDAIAFQYQKYQHIPNQKDFALAVKQSPFKNVLFGLRNGKFKTILEGLAALPKKQLQALYANTEVDHFLN